MANFHRPLPFVVLLFGVFAQFAVAADSPVADAAMKSDHAAVRALLQKKADVNAPQIDGATALQWAAYHDDLELADILIAAGANPVIWEPVNVNARAVVFWESSSVKRVEAVVVSTVTAAKIPCMPKGAEELPPIFTVSLFVAELLDASVIETGTLVD